MKLRVQYSPPEDEYNMFETCRRQDELNHKTNLKVDYVG